jgi:hypothetical protein
MQCFEIRRRLQAAPREHAAALYAHLAQCEVCRRVAADLLRFDRAIASAASVAAPEGLAARILLRKRGRLAGLARTAKLLAPLLALV